MGLRKADRRMSEARVCTVYEMVEKTNPLSGHSFTYSTEKILGYEVWGGFFGVTKHRTLKAAEKERDARNAYNEKFPWEPPRTEKEKEWLTRTK